MTIPTFPSLIGIAWPVKRSPLWSTLKQPAISGLETRFPLWSLPRWKYSLTYDLLRSDAVNLEWQTLVGFFNEVQAAAGQLFQFTDQNDNAVTNQSFGTGDGATTAFQLVRAMGGFVEPVLAVTGTPTIKDNGATVSAANYTIGSSGIVTFTTAPLSGHALTWTGSFNWYCRFDND